MVIYLSFILDVELKVGSFFSELFFFLANVEGTMSFLQLANWRTECEVSLNKYFPLQLVFVFVKFNFPICLWCGAESDIEISDP